MTVQEGVPEIFCSDMAELPGSYTPFDFSGSQVSMAAAMGENGAGPWDRTTSRSPAGAGEAF